MCRIMTIATIRAAIRNAPENKEFTDKGWEPIFMADPRAKIVIIGQAPGIKAQESGAVFRDKSGDKLREWMGITEDAFYESGKIAVLPLDFYFPGKGKTGDLPPRKGVAEQWHTQLLALMPEVELIILIGLYAQKSYLHGAFKGTLTETVFAYKEYYPPYFPLVHPSPLNFRWHTKNPDFVTAVVPELQKIVQKIMK